MATRKQKDVPGKIAVPNADSMLAQVFRLHCQMRHPVLGLWARGEHAADHRLHPDMMDHIHDEKKVENVEPEPRDSGEPDPDTDQ